MKAKRDAAGVPLGRPRKGRVPGLKEADGSQSRRLPTKHDLVTITLQMRQSINGKFYGPGTVTVTEAKARAFLNVEHEAMQKEVELQQQRAYIIGMGAGGPVKKQVPYAQFDRILAGN